MHVLCAPPAFILSQDQTLLFLFEFFLSSFLFHYLFGTFLFWNYRLVSFSLKVLLFTFQCTLFSLFSIEDDLHYTIPFSFCQYFFLIIFYFFLPSFRQNKKLVILVFFLFFLSFFITNFFRFFFFFLLSARYFFILSHFVLSCQHFLIIFFFLFLPTFDYSHHTSFLSSKLYILKYFVETFLENVSMLVNYFFLNGNHVKIYTIFYI